MQPVPAAIVEGVCAWNACDFNSEYTGVYLVWIPLQHKEAA